MENCTEPEALAEQMKLAFCLNTHSPRRKCQTASLPKNSILYRALARHLVQDSRSLATENFTDSPAVEAPLIGALSSSTIRYPIPTQRKLILRPAAGTVLMAGHSPW